jgi:tetratricopeptide (TPR) repeat protein
LLAGLVRKEVFSAQVDPRSPERGQYGFLQELLRQVSYETLSRHDRKSRHLAAIAAFEQSVDHDAPEVLATHLVAAYDAAPDDDDARAIRIRARAALAQAAERAAARAAPEEGRRLFDQAAALADDEPSAQAELLERAGRFAHLAGQSRAARERLERALALYGELGDTHAQARAGVVLADVDHADGRLNDAARRAEAAIPTLELAGPSHELAASLAQLGRAKLLGGEIDPVGPELERALAIAESLALYDVIVDAMTSKGLVLHFAGRLVEGRVVLEGALTLARTHDLREAEWRAANNLGEMLQDGDLFAEAVELYAQIEAEGRLRGARNAITSARMTAARSLIELGEWDEVVARALESIELESSVWARSEIAYALFVYCERGELDRAEAFLKDFEWSREGEQTEMPASFAAIESRLLRAQGRPAEALAAAERGYAYRALLSISSMHVKRCIIEALENALALGDLSIAERLIADLERLLPGEVTPALNGERYRFRARIGALAGRHERVDSDFREAAAAFGTWGLPFRLAVTQLEHGEWLREHGREDEAQALLRDASTTFERLRATPWIERVEAASPDRVTA